MMLRCVRYLDVKKNKNRRKQSFEDEWNNMRLY